MRVLNETLKQWKNEDAQMKKGLAMKYKPSVLRAVYVEALASQLNQSLLSACVHIGNLLFLGQLFAKQPEVPLLGKES